MKKSDKACSDAENACMNDIFIAGLKKFSNWPTYPQIYIKGELIGGLDIIKVQ